MACPRSTVVVTLALAWAIEGASPAQGNGDQLKAADLQRNTYNYAAANASYSEVLNAKPQLPNAWRVYYGRALSRIPLGMLIQARDDLKQAISLLEKAQTEEPSQPTTLGPDLLAWRESHEELQAKLKEAIGHKGVIDGIVHPVVVTVQGAVKVASVKVNNRTASPAQSGLAFLSEVAAGPYWVDVMVDGGRSCLAVGDAPSDSSTLR